MIRLDAKGSLVRDGRQTGLSVVHSDQDTKLIVDFVSLHLPLPQPHYDLHGNQPQAPPFAEFERDVEHVIANLDEHLHLVTLDAAAPASQRGQALLVHAARFPLDAESNLDEVERAQAHAVIDHAVALSLTTVTLLDRSAGRSLWGRVNLASPLVAAAMKRPWRNPGRLLAYLDSSRPDLFRVEMGIRKLARPQDLINLLFDDPLWGEAPGLLRRALDYGADPKLTMDAAAWRLAYRFSDSQTAPAVAIEVVATLNPSEKVLMSNALRTLAYQSDAKLLVNTNWPISLAQSIDAQIELSRRATAGTVFAAP